MIDLSHGSGFAPGRAPQGQFDLSQQITAAIDEGLAKDEAKKSQRRYLGASELGHECTRYLVYRYRNVEQAAPEPRMRRIWAAGHGWEAILIDWLRLAGFAIRGQQHEFSQADGRIKGHIDGAIVSGPAPLPYPVLLELKALNNRSWQDLAKRGLAVSKPIYTGQTQLYMGYLDLGHTLFGALNKDTEELLWLLIPYDRAEAQRVSDRAVEVIRCGESGTLPPRIARERSYWLCRLCGYAETCWKAAD